MHGVTYQSKLSLSKTKPFRFLKTMYNVPYCPFLVLLRKFSLAGNLKTAKQKRTTISVLNDSLKFSAKSPYIKAEKEETKVCHNRVPKLAIPVDQKQTPENREKRSRLSGDTIRTHLLSHLYRTLKNYWQPRKILQNLFSKIEILFFVLFLEKRKRNFQK